MSVDRAADAGMGSEMKEQIFISYARNDLPWVQKLVRQLELYGLTVWWDRTIPPGKSFEEVITTALDNAMCVVVVWSGASVSSEWVKAEAEEGRSRGILCPVMIEDVKPPLIFRHLQSAVLIDWNGSAHDPQFSLLVRSVKEVVGAADKIDCHDSDVIVPLVQAEQIQSDDRLENELSNIPILEDVIDRDKKLDTGEQNKNNAVIELAEDRRSGCDPFVEVSKVESQVVEGAVESKDSIDRVSESVVGGEAGGSIEEGRSSVKDSKKRSRGGLVFIYVSLVAVVVYGAYKFDNYREERGKVKNGIASTTIKDRATKPNTVSSVIFVSSNVDGAQVLLDGVNKGIIAKAGMQKKIGGIRSGVHVLEVSKDEYSLYKKKVSLGGGKEEVVYADLYRVDGEALLEIVANVGGSNLIVDDEEVGSVERISNIRLPVGVHSIRLELPGYRTVTKLIDVRENMRIYPHLYKLSSNADGVAEKVEPTKSILDEFVKDYVAHLNRGGDKFIEMHYADYVDYYSKNSYPKSDVLASKARYFEYWNTVKYKLYKAAKIIKASDNNASIGLLLVYSIGNREDDRGIYGLSQLQLELEQLDGVWRVIKEDSNLLYRESGNYSVLIRPNIPPMVLYYAEIESRLMLDRNSRREIQRKLKLLGFDISKIDGSLGEKSREEIRKWQGSVGLMQTGYFDDESYVRLLDSNLSGVATKNVAEVLTARVDD